MAIQLPWFNRTKPQDDEGATETSPLLNNPSSSPSSAGNHVEINAPKKTTPLPVAQLSILCLMRMTEPISYAVIFPFVTQMLYENLPHVPVEKIGYYAGIVESTFAFVQFLTILFWGRLSDSIGRKPVLLTGLCGTFISINCFGLSSSFAAMAVSRCISGLMNGNIAVLKSVIGEITDDTNQGKAFALVPICFAIGSIIGPSIGGYLAHPAETFPEWFGSWTFFLNYPFFLPCFVASLFNLFGFVTGLVFLKETLPPKDRKKSNNAVTQTISEEEAISTLVQVQVQPKPSSTDRSVKNLMTSSILRVLGTQFCLNLLNSCHTALVPLFLYESIDLGGLSFSNSDIGTFLAIVGIVTIFIQLFVYPPLEKKLGSTVLVYRRVTLFLPLVWVSFPIAHYFAVEKFSFPLAMPSVPLALGIAFKAISNLSIVCSSVLVNNSAPTRNSLGTLNAISQMFGSLSRTIGPTMATSLFAFSISNKILYGQFVWIVLWAVAFGTWMITLRVDAPSKAAWRQRQ